VGIQGADHKNEVRFTAQESVLEYQLDVGMHLQTTYQMLLKLFTFKTENKIIFTVKCTHTLSVTKIKNK
jgi:hypothetical protein